MFHLLHCLIVFRLSVCSRSCFTSLSRHQVRTNGCYSHNFVKELFFTQNFLSQEMLRPHWREPYTTLFRLLSWIFLVVKHICRRHLERSLGVIGPKKVLDFVRKSEIHDQLQATYSKLLTNSHNSIHQPRSSLLRERKKFKAEKLPPFLRYLEQGNID